MKLSKGRSAEIDNFDIAALKILTRLTFQENIDEEIIDLVREMELEYDSIIRKYKILEERVNIDPKTSLLKYNEHFLVNIVKSISRYLQTTQKSEELPISYVRIDLDDFSKINNRYGHEVGDRTLVQVATVMKKLSRPTDYIFRFGGEEFDVVLPLLSVDDTKIYVEKLLKGIRKIKIPLDNGESIRVTASMGFSQFLLNFGKEKRIEHKKILEYYHKAQKQADCATYMSKYMGKNRFSIYEEGIDYKKIQLEYSQSK